MSRRTEAYALGVAKLESSGLTLEDAKQLGFKILEPEETRRLHHSFEPLPALLMPYWDPLVPSMAMRFSPGHDDFFRIRYLKDPSGFKAQTDKKPTRYLQPPNTGTCAFFPRLTDWASIVKNPNEVINITEGELKAAKATKAGFFTIGLGGVHNFRVSKQGIGFLAELEKVDWKRRWVNIIYDSDVRGNPNVSSALNELAEELYLRGADPHYLLLPEVLEGQKTGLDDFLVHSTPDALDILIDQHCEPLTPSRPLWELNKTFVFVRNPGLVIDQHTLQRMSPTGFQDIYGDQLCYDRKVSKDGNVMLERTSAAKLWLKWPLRDNVHKLTYEPGKEPRLPDRFNLWPGWGCQPKRGSVKPFLDLLKHLFKGAPAEDLEWFLRWCAYPIQYPGTKLTSSVVLFGVKHGTGKSLIGYTLGKIYGPNFTEIRQADLIATFNEWANGRQFVMVDDITGTNNRQDADVIKKLITQKEIWINQKNIQQYAVPDCINYLFTTNQPDAFFLEDDDRRFFIHEVAVDPLEESFYVDYDLWLSSGGPAAVFHYLLNLDLGDFQPFARARATSAKERMTADTRSDLGSWVRQLLASPDAILKVGEAAVPGDLFTNKQLLDLYDPTGHTRTTANGLGRELKRAGAFQVLGGRPMTGPDGKVDRWYAIRNRDRWLTATAADVAAHLGEGKPKARKPKF